MLCPNCESVNRDGAKFCDECGFPLTGAIAAVAAGAEPVKEREQVQLESVTEAISAIEDTEAEEAVIEFPESEELEEIPEDEFDPAQVEEPAPDDFEEAVPQESLDPDVTVALGADLAGLDVIEDEYGERVVGPDYQEPQVNWRDGHTMQMPRIEGEETPRSKDFLASSTVKQEKSKKAIIGVVVAVVVIAALVAFATYQMELWGGKVIPDVRGMTEADATSVLKESGFDVRSTKVKSDDTEGLVLIMDPNAGTRAEEGSEIVIHIATAREIPDVVGKTEEEAVAMFKDDGYENVTYEKERSDSPEGTVLSVSPEAGTRAKSTMAVIVKVAEPYIVPDSSSLDLDGTIAAIQAAGLGYDIFYYDTTDYVEGTVLGTEPAAGTKVQSSTIVVITVARARGVQLVQLTRDLITPGYELNIGGTPYIVVSLDSAEYIGNDQVAFTATGRPYTYFFGVYVEGDPQKISGVATWTADNQLASIS